MKNMLKEIEKLAVKMGSIEAIKSELKRVQSIKCRLKKQKKRADYEKEMTKVVKYEQALKESREYFEPKKMFVTDMTADDIKILNFDETMKAIKSIQSKKCNSQYLETKTEYEHAIVIENLLLEHKKNVRPIEETVVKKTDLKTIINELESLENVSKEYLIEQLKNLI